MVQNPTVASIRKSKSTMAMVIPRKGDSQSKQIQHMIRRRRQNPQLATSAAQFSSRETGNGQNHPLASQRDY